MEPEYKAGILSGIVFACIIALIAVLIIPWASAPGINAVTVTISLLGTGIVSGAIGGIIFGAVFKYTHKRLPTQNSIVKAFILFLIADIIFFATGYNTNLISLATSTILSAILYGVLYDHFVKKGAKGLQIPSGK